MPPIAPEKPIAGRHHPLIRRIRAMVRSGILLEGGEVLLETPHLIEDAIHSGVAIHTLLVRSDVPPPVRALVQRVPEGAEHYSLEPKLFSQLSSTESNPGIIALAKAPRWREQHLFSGKRTLLLVLAGIQDPGNLGTILRAAEAFGATGVLATKGTVNPFNAKAIRAASGSLFRLPVIVSLSPRGIVSLLRREKVLLLACTPREGNPLAQIDASKPLAVALGSEGAGLPRELEEAGRRVSLPMAHRVESLNVASAAAVILYEIARQRQSVEPTEKVMGID